MAARLNHPNVCTIHEVGEAEGQVYVAIELVPGQALSERLACGRMGVDEAIRLGQQMADALAPAHENAVVHRDFKSPNVIVTPEGRAKVLDFGLAKQLVEMESEATTVTGTPLAAIVERYLAKEPAQRYSQAGEVRSALETLRAEGVPTVPWRPGLRARRRWALPAGVAVVVAVAAVMAVGGLGGGCSGGSTPAA